MQNAFAANFVNRRDIGINILSDEERYPFNYAIGIYNGTGLNLTREGTSVSQALPNNTSLPSAQRRTYNYDTRLLTGELMYTVRLLYKISGNPGYGQGDILNSRIPQVAIGAGYAYNPAQNYLSSIRSDIVDRFYRQNVSRNFNGRLLGGGIYDFQTYEADFIAKYQGWSLQAEGYYRHQRVRSHDSEQSHSIPRRSRLVPRWSLAKPMDGMCKWESTSFRGSWKSRADMESSIRPPGNPMISSRNLVWPLVTVSMGRITTG